MIPNYTLELLNPNSVNLIIDYTAEIEGVTYQLKRERTCYANSPTGRQQVIDRLPEQYVTSIFAVWGDEPTIKDPEPPVIDAEV